MSQSQDKKQLDEKQLDNKGKWYQNNWFILTVSVVMIALLVFSVFLSNQWNKIERTIFGNKAFYYKMEMENFYDITERFSSSIDYAYEAKTATKGSTLLKSGGQGVVVDIYCDNDDHAELTQFGMDLFKEGAKKEGNGNQTQDANVNSSDNTNNTNNVNLPMAELDVFIDNHGIWAEFPSSGAATHLYKVGNNLSRKMFKPDWLSAINNSDVSWAIFDMLQAANNAVPDENVFHYDEAEFDDRPAHKIEFVLDEQTQQNMKKAVLDCYNKKEIKQVINKMEDDLWEQFETEEKLSTNNAHNKKSGNGKNSKTSKKNKKSRQLYKNIKTFLKNIPCSNGTITYSVIYDDDQNILSRELVLSDNRIQALSYTENGELVLALFNEKLGLNIENKCSFNNGIQRGVEGRLIIDSGADELGVVYNLNAVIGGVFPVGKVEVLAGRTGVAESDGGAIPVWKADYNLSKVAENVSLDFALEKNQKNIFSLEGNFVVDRLTEKITGKTMDEREKAKPTSGISWQNLLSETVWNYTLSK